MIYKEIDSLYWKQSNKFPPNAAENDAAGQRASWVCMSGVDRACLITLPWALKEYLMLLDYSSNPNVYILSWNVSLLSHKEHDTKCCNPSNVSNKQARSNLSDAITTLLLLLQCWKKKKKKKKNKKIPNAHWHFAAAWRHSQRPNKQMNTFFPTPNIQLLESRNAI